MRKRDLGFVFSGILCIIAALVYLVGPLKTAPLAAGESPETGKDISSGHGESPQPYDPREFAPEQRERMERLFYRVMCACPRENWSRTLAGCPEACADPQKREIRAAVKAGKTDQEILEEQQKKYGPQALAIPDSTLASLLPYLGLGTLTVIVLWILYRSVHRAPRDSRAEETSEISEESSLSAEDQRISEVVERDLREMDI